MYENRKDLLLIVRKYLDGQATEEETAFLESYYHFFDREESFVDQLQQEEKKLLEKKLEKGIWSIVDQSVPNTPAKVQRLWPRIAIAASILIVFSIGTYYFLNKPKAPNQAMVAKANHDVLPGGNKAYLTLGNGQRISLSDARNGTIANQPGQTIQKTADGTIEYDNSHNNHNIAEVIFNTIETPRGGQYQVTLPDGSKVWLNAASSLKYPAQFTQGDRIVELTGEAYFEVAKDKTHPFKVKTDKQTVEVLGTHFNINSYSDEPQTKTTLLEGSVKVQTDNDQMIIKPGDQAVLKNNKIKIAHPELDEVVAWKNGQTLFNDESLESIMRTVSRWYDVDIQYQGVNKQQLFYGGVSRYDNVSKVLKVLEMTGGVHFRIEGKTIYITK